MKYFSLFSGIGGFELGMPKDWECVGYSEIDKYAIQIYQKHFPKHKNYGDATKIITKELPNFDILVAGFPCQAFSIAGKRKGFDDTRGTLFFEIARILRDKRPRHFLLENVKGLLSHDKGKTFQTILKVLADLGYGLEWQVLNSKNFGVPQNRERVFIVGHIRGIPRPKIFPIGGTTQGSIKVRARGKHQQDIVYDKEGILNLPAGTHGSTPHLTKIIDGGQAYRVYSKKGLSPTIPTPSGGHHIPKIRVLIKGKKYKRKPKNGKIQGGDSSSISSRVYGKKGLTPALMTQERVIPKITEDMKIRRLTPTECERLQGFPDGWTEGVSDTQRYKTLGNAVTVNVVREIMKRF